MKYSGFDIVLDSCSKFLLSDGSVDKNVIIFGADMSSLHINNKRKDIWIPGKGPTQGFDSTTFTAKAKYSINFTQSNGTFCLSLHYNGSNCFLFLNAIKTYKFKVKYSEIKKSLVFRKYFKGFHSY